MNITAFDIRDAISKCKDFDLTIEFDTHGIIFRGYYISCRFNRKYSYESLENLSDNITFEFLVEEFKKEFDFKRKMKMASEN